MPLPVTNNPAQNVNNADQPDSLFASLGPTTRAVGGPPTGPVHPDDSLFTDLSTTHKTLVSGPGAPTESGQTRYSALQDLKDNSLKAKKASDDANSLGSTIWGAVNPINWGQGLFGLAKSIGDNPGGTASAAASGLLNGATLGNGEAFSNGVTTIAKNLGVSDKTAQSIGGFFNSGKTNGSLPAIKSGFDFAGQAAPYMVSDGILASGLKYSAAPFIAKYGRFANFLREKVLPAEIAFNAIGQTQEALKGSDVKTRLQRAGIDSTLAGVFPAAEEVFGALKNTIFKSGISKTEPFVEAPAESAAAPKTTPPGTMADVKPGDVNTDLRPQPPETGAPKVRDINRPTVAVTVPETAVNTGAGKEGTAKIVTNDVEALQNYIKGSSDITYKQVDSLGKDINGDPIMARHSFDPETGQHVIYTTDATTASSLAHELGHYFDAKLMGNVNRLSTMIPGAIKNPSTLEDALTSYAVKVLGGDATGKEISMKIASMADSMQQEIDALSRARRGGVAAKGNSEKFADAVSQILVKGGAKDAPVLSGFLEHANETKDAMSLFGRKATAAVKAVSEMAAPVKGVTKGVVAEARNYASAEDFVKAQTDSQGFRPVAKDEVLPSGYTTKVDITTGKTVTDAPLSEAAQAKLETAYEKANAGVESNKAKVKDFVEGSAPEAKPLTRIPTGRQPATIPIKSENITKDVDLEVFMNTKILPAVTGAERIAKSDAEIMARAVQSDFTAKDFDTMLTKRFGNMSEDLVRAKQYMVDGAKSLADALDGRAIKDIPEQEAKDIIGQYNRVVQMFEVFSGARTELSNSFRSLGFAVNPGENDVLQTALGAIQKAVGDEKDPFKIAQNMMNAQKSPLVEKYFKIWYPAVLSGPKTQVRLMLGDAGAVTVQTLSNLFTSEGRATFGDRVAAMVNGQKDAINYAVRVFKGEDTIYSNYYEPAIPKMREFKGPGAFFEAVGGFMEGMKGYFAKTYELGEIAALDKGGYTYGLSNKAVIDSVNEAVGKVASQTATYINPGEDTTLGTINKVLQNLKSSDKQTVAVMARFLAPFTKIVTNITDRAIDFTPIINLGRTFGDSALYEGRATRILATAGFKESILGEAKAAGLDAVATKNYIADETSRVKDIIVGRLRDQQMGRFYMGIAATGAFLPLAVAGRVTGNGPADANQKALLMQTGWRPDSIILPDGTAMPYDNFLGPLKLILAITGNISDSIKFKSDATDIQTKIMDGFIRFTKSELDQSFLSGITNFIDTLSGNKSPTSFFDTMAANAIPIPAIYTQAKDTLFPERYNATNFNETLRNKLGITGSIFGLPALQPKTDALGNPVKADIIYGSLPPIGNEDMKDDPVYSFMAKNDAFVGKPSNKLVIKGNNNGQERGITPDEYTQYVTDSGKDIYAKLNSEIAAGYFDKFTNKKEIKNAIDSIAQPIRTKYKNKIKY